ncbi:hypothetical protein J6590_060401 [Homalodisca vitripennis]|nr:hypothetical protein J6590_060401 [Homalodisca vitripennis]
MIVYMETEVLCSVYKAVTETERGTFPVDMLKWYDRASKLPRNNDSTTKVGSVWALLPRKGTNKICLWRVNKTTHHSANERANNECVPPRRT